MQVAQLKKKRKSSTPRHEENFCRLRALLPSLDTVSFMVGYDPSRSMSLQMEVLERFRYTTTVLLTLFPIASSPHFSTCRMKVRIYQDARVAEVVEFQGHGRFDPFYDYPNQQMFYPDEKVQVNDLLCEMLTFCKKRKIHFR